MSATKKNGSEPRTLQVYKSYNFRDKDPVIDYVRTWYEDSGLSMKQMHEKSNVATTTAYNWFHGKTKRPQFATVAAVLIACGAREINLSALTKKR